MSWLWDYFNLSARAGIQIVVEPIPWSWQLALYGVLVLGILANGYLATARSSRRRYRLNWRRFLVAAIIGLVIFPAVFEGAQANLGQPSLVQLALIFASGMGYESLFTGAVALVDGARRR